MAGEVRFVGSMDRAIYLATLPGFVQLKPDDTAMFAEQAREQFFRKGDVVLRRGEPVRTSHIVVEGALRATGEGLRDSRVGPRQGVGLLSLLARSPRGVEAVAESDALTLAFDADVLQELFEDNLVLLIHQMRNVAARTLEVRQRMAHGTFLSDLEPVSYPERGLDLVERILLLRGRGPFARASLDALTSVAAALTETRVGAGTCLWRAGDASGHLIMILDGTVRCTFDEGRASFRCGAGYPLGNVESMAGQRRWFDALAETPVVGLRGETDTFLDILEDHFQMAAEFLASMAGHLVALLEDERAAR